jgi:hypothetical protein
MSILVTGVVSIILVTSQTPIAFAGFCSEPAPDVDCDGDGYTPNEGDCEDDDPEIFPGQGCPIPPSTAVDAILDQVDDMLESGDLEINKGEINAIIGKLEKAMDKLDSGNYNAAIGSLNAFINQINAFINSGSISPENGKTLIDAAQSIIDSL